MDLSFSEAQQQLKAAARQRLAEACPNELVRNLEDDDRGISTDLWRAIVSEGWTSLALPPEHGGGGGSFLDVSVICEEMGRAMTPGPFLDVVLSEYLLNEHASEDQKQRLLPKLANGSLVSTVALTETDGSFEATGIACAATRRGDEWQLNGLKLFVSNAHIANCLLVLARTRVAQDAEDGLSLFVVDLPAAGALIERLPGLGADRQCEVILDDVTLPGSSLVGAEHGAWPAINRHLQRAAVLSCLWSVGGSERVLEITTDYAKSRVQFGRPIGTFQAISHKCADMAVDVDGMRFVSYHAAWLLSEGLPAAFETSVAKAWTSDAFQRVTDAGHLILAGVGFTKANDMQMYSRRSTAAALAYGDADFHRELVAQRIGL